MVTVSLSPGSNETQLSAVVCPKDALAALPIHQRQFELKRSLLAFICKRRGDEPLPFVPSRSCRELNVRFGQRI